MDPASAKKRWRGSTAAGMAVLFLMAGSVSAQWLRIPLPGTPRTPDGRPDLTAPAPRTPDDKPDLSGIWQRPRRGGGIPGTPGTAGNAPNNIAEGVEVLFQPWAEALYKLARLLSRQVGRRCLGCSDAGIQRGHMD